MRALRSQISELREECIDLSEERSTSVLEYTKTISSQALTISDLERQVTALSSSLTHAQKLADDRETTIRSLKDKLDGTDTDPTDATHPSKAAGRATTDQESETWAVVRDELHRQSSYLHTLELTNSRLTVELTALRDRHASVEVLREEKRGLESRLRALEGVSEKLARAEAEADAARKEREEW
jgi:mitotic spindle assembly checkpoint protein MAD1